MKNMIELSNSFKEKTFKNSHKETLNRETITERIYKLNNNSRIVEGLILKHQTKDSETGDFYDSQKHLIGYHYFVLQSKEDGKKRYTDIEGFQGRIRDKQHYHYLIYNKSPIESVKDSLTYGQGLNLFCERNKLEIKNDYQRVRQLAIEKGIIKETE